MHFTTSTILGLVRNNWKSGLTVALISVPLSIALSIASGAGPIPGIITGIWATAIAALFGSSNYNVIGAAGALTTVLFAATLAAPMQLGAAILPLLAIGSGLIILLIWAVGLDRFLYYIPSSVMYGFAAGVAFLIAISQLFDATGLSAIKRTGTFVGDLMLLLENIANVHFATIFIFISFLVFLLVWKRTVNSIPAVIPTAVVGIIFGWLEATQFDIGLISLGEKFGEIVGALALPVPLDTFSAIAANPEVALWIFKGAALIAFIAVLETLITAKIADKLTKTQSSSSKELLGLSLANIGSGVMGGLPATGVFIRTGANIKAGATHRTSALLAALFTALGAVFILPFFSYLPVAVIAAILMNTAIGLIETEKFKEFWRHEKESFAIALVVALITVVEDAGIAVGLGAIASLLLFANRISHGRFDVFFNYADGTVQEMRGIHLLHVPTNKDIAVVTYSIAGYLGYIDNARHAANFRHLARASNVQAVIIRLRDLFSIDYEGLEMLTDAVAVLKQSGKKVCIASANQTIADELSLIPSVKQNLANNDMTMKTAKALSTFGIHKA